MHEETVTLLARIEEIEESFTPDLSPSSPEGTRVQQLKMKLEQPFPAILTLRGKTARVVIPLRAQ